MSRSSTGLTPKRKALMIFVFFVLLVLAIVNCANWYLFGSLRATLEGELERYVTGVATIIGRQIPWQTVSRFVPGDESSTEYRDLTQLLEENRRTFELSDVTVLDPSNKTLFSLSTILGIGAENPAVLLDEQGLGAAWSGKAAAGEVVRVHDGYLLTAFAPIRAPDGTVGAVVAVDTDVTFYHVLEILRRLIYVVTVLSLIGITVLGLLFRRLLKYFLDTDEALQRTDKLATVGKLAASVTHEIRNPLGIMTTTAELIQKRLARAEADPQMIELFGYILGEIDRLNAIITRFLDLARTTHAQIQSLTIRELIAPTEALVAKDMAREGIHFETRLGHPDSVVDVDPAKLRQVLVNCLINAQEAMKESPRKKLELSADLARDGARQSLVLVISDSGPGIPFPIRERLFEPFVTTKPTGSGIGLAVVKSILDEHHGTVEVDSGPDRGTRFTFRIPVTGGDPS